MTGDLPRPVMMPAMPHGCEVTRQSQHVNRMSKVVNKVEIVVDPIVCNAGHMWGIWIHDAELFTIGTSHSETTNNQNSAVDKPSTTFRSTKVSWKHYWSIFSTCKWLIELLSMKLQLQVTIILAVMFNQLCQVLSHEEVGCNNILLINVKLGLRSLKTTPSSVRSL